MASRKPLNILFGTNFRVGQTGEFAYLALKRMGHKVIGFTPEMDAPDEWLKVPADLDAEELASGYGPSVDLFLMVESSTGTPFLPRNISKVSIPTGYWMYDNYLNIRWNKEVAALFDYCFFAQLNRLELARRYGCDNLAWAPFAADEQFHRNFHKERDIDIGYVGSITDQKKRYFSAFEKSGLRVVTNDRYLSYEEIGEFYSRCKLVYNILARRDMNVRTFEASAAGALVINQRFIDEGCHVIFREGESMMFHEFDDAAQICRDLLADDETRERMASNAEKIVMSGHTYRHRMESIIEIMSKGVTESRLERSVGHYVHMAEALTCLHPHFRWRERGLAELMNAFRKAPLRSMAYLVKYCYYRIMEKVEKVKWSFGKAPV